MAYSELLWRPFLEHQAWCWTTLRRGNIFYYVYKRFFIFVTFLRFYRFFIFIWTFLHQCCKRGNRIMDLLHVSGGAGHQRSCKQSMSGQRGTAASAASAQCSSVSGPIRRAMSSRLTVSRVATRPRPSHRLLYYYALRDVSYTSFVCLLYRLRNRWIRIITACIYTMEKKSRRMKELHLRLRWSASAGDDRVPDEVGKTHGEMTSRSLWSRYDRHFVGIVWHNALS